MIIYDSYPLNFCNRSAKVHFTLKTFEEFGCCQEQTSMYSVLYVPYNH